MSVVSHLINDELVESQRMLEVTNPSTGKVIRLVADASAADVERAIAAAQATFPAWRDTLPAKRAQVRSGTDVSNLCRLRDSSVRNLRRLSSP